MPAVPPYLTLILPNVHTLTDSEGETVHQTTFRAVKSMHATRADFLETQVGVEAVQHFKRLLAIL